MPGVSPFAKWWSGSSSPARCAFCGQLSFVRTSEATGILIMSLAIVLTTIVTAFVWQSLAALIVGVPVAILYYARGWRGATLVPVSREQARRAAGDGWLFLAVVALGIVLYLALRQGTG